MDTVRILALLFGAGVAVVAQGNAASAAQATGNPDFSSLPEQARKNIQRFKIGSYHAPIFKDHVLIGYATLTFEADRLVSMQRFGLYNAPPEVRANSVSTLSSCDGPVITYVSEDIHNVYYYATFPDGAWFFYAVNKGSGEVTIIGSGRESAEIC